MKSLGAGMQISFFRMQKALYAQMTATYDVAVVLATYPFSFMSFF